MKSALLSVVLLITTYVQAIPTNDKQVRENMKFGMQAVITAKEGKGGELVDIMLEASQAVAEMEGCLLYLVQQSLTDDSKVLITEVWASKESHAASLTNETVRTLIMKAKPIIVDMDHIPAKYIGGHGI